MKDQIPSRQTRNWWIKSLKLKMLRNKEFSKVMKDEGFRDKMLLWLSERDLERCRKKNKII